MKKPILILSVLLGLTTFSCNKEATEPEDETESWEVTAILTPNGLGDFGYNDQMYLGFCYIREQLGCKVFVKSPSTVEEANVMSQTWMDAIPTANTHRLLVLCEDDYQAYVKEQGWESTPDRAILQIDSRDESAPFYTRSLPLYGACYAIGRICQETLEGTGKHAAIAMANDVDESITEGRDGFLAAADECGLQVDVHYLCNDADPYGFSSPDSLYHLCYEINDEVGFLLPLAGGTNNGVYHYGRELQNSAIWTVALDSDMAYTTYRCCYGIMTRIDNLLLDFCRNWKEGMEQPMHGVCGVSSGYVTVEANPYQDLDIEWGSGLEAVMPDVVEHEKARYADYNLIVK